MKWIHTIYLLIFIIPVSSTILAQESSVYADDAKPNKKEYYFISPRVSVTVPHPVSNSSFKKSFTGVYEINSGLNFMLYKGLFVGATYKTGLFKVMENKIPDYNARMAINNVAVKVGGDSYVGENNRMLFSAAVSMGKNWTHFSSLICKDPAKHSLMINSYTTTFIEPEMNLFFLVESNFGIGVTLSYTIFNRNFDPFELCLDDWASFDKNAHGATQHLSFGFGFYYSLLKKKKY